jgi:hypothetical protein
LKQHLSAFIIVACALLVALCGTASAQKTKGALQTEINNNFPDNIAGQINPAIARSTFGDFVNSWQQNPGVNVQTGTNYTVQPVDYGQLITFNNAAPVTLNIPQANSAGFVPFNFYVTNYGAGTVTLTPTVSNICGVVTKAITQNSSIWVVSDGANWQCFQASTAAGGTPGGANTQVQYNNSGAFGGSANLTWNSPALTVGVAGATTGQLNLTGAASGTITVQGQAAGAGTYNFNLPTTAGIANQPLLSGGGGGAAMAWGFRSGNTTSFVTTTGNLTSGDCAKFDGSGNLVDNGGGCGSVVAGSTSQVQFNVSGALSASAHLIWAQPALTIGLTGSSTGQLNLTGSGSGKITIQGQAAAGTYNFNLPITAGASGQPLMSGGGGASAMGWGFVTGTTTSFATTNGAFTNGHCVSVDANFNMVDAGGPCSVGGGGGTVTASPQGEVAYYSATGVSPVVSGAATLIWDNTNVALGVGTSTPYADNNNMPGIVFKQAADVEEFITAINPSTTANAAAAFRIKTGTVSSFVHFGLHDNTGNPFWHIENGPNVNKSYIDSYDHNFRDQPGSTIWAELISGQFTATRISGFDGANASVFVAKSGGAGGNAGQGGQIQLINTSAGATNINKYLRNDQTGRLQFYNSGYTTPILQIADSGGPFQFATIASPSAGTNPATGFLYLWADYLSSNVLRTVNPSGIASNTVVPSYAPANQFATGISSNGVIQYAPAPGGVAGPGSSIIGGVATWSNTSGTTLADGRGRCNMQAYGAAPGNSATVNSTAVSNAILANCNVLYFPAPDTVAAKDFAQFTARIDNGTPGTVGSVLTASAPFTGTPLVVGMLITDAGNVSTTTYIMSYGTGTGGAGTYNVSQNIFIASESVSGGGTGYPAGNSCYQINSPIIVSANTLGVVGDGPAVSCIAGTTTACDVFMQKTTNAMVAHILLRHTTNIGCGLDAQTATNANPQVFDVYASENNIGVLMGYCSSNCLWRGGGAEFNNSDGMQMGNGPGGLNAQWGVRDASLYGNGGNGLTIGDNSTPNIIDNLTVYTNGGSGLLCASGASGVSNFRLTNSIFGGHPNHTIYLQCNMGGNTPGIIDDVLAESPNGVGLDSIAFTGSGPLHISRFMSNSGDGHGLTKCIVAVGGAFNQEVRISQSSCNGFNNSALIATNVTAPNLGVLALSDNQFAGNAANMSAAKIDNGAGGSGNILNVSGMNSGTLLLGMNIFGANVTGSTYITATHAQDATLTGAGGTGTYRVSQNSNTAGNEAMTAGSVGINIGNNWALSSHGNHIWGNLTNVTSNAAPVTSLGDYCTPAENVIFPAPQCTGFGNMATFTANGTNSVYVATSKITSNSNITFSLQTPGSNPPTCAPYVVSVAGPALGSPGFNVKACGTDNSVYQWLVQD